MNSAKQNGQWIPENLNPDGYDTIPDFLADVCRKHTEKPAFTSLGRTLSYAELDRLSAAFAVYLQRETGLEPGDRIAIQLPNLIQYPIVLFGALRAGLVVVNTNPLYTAAEMEHQFCDSGAKALVIHKSMAHNAEKILHRTEIEHVFVTQVGDLHGFVKRHLLNAAVKYIKKMEPRYNLPGAVGLRDALLRYLDQEPAAVERSCSDLAVLQYTGGTTGVSKGAMLTHANLLSNMLQGVAVIREVGSDWADNVLSPLPLYHIYAFTVAQIILAAGGHSILIPNPRDLPGLVKEISHWKITTFLGLNTLFVGLCNNAEFRALDFSSLRMTLSGGMALTHAAADRWKEVTGCTVLEAYGLTETSPAVSINPPHAIRTGTIGIPVPETEVAIIGPQGEHLPEGIPGELCVKGPQVMPGYWHNEAATRASFTDDGYLITGDIAVLEEGGYLRIVDRAKDLIIVSGFNVYPNEVEDAATDHPGVIECAAIGIPDSICGEVVKLIAVRSDDTLSEEELRAWCQERLTRYKVPKIIEFVPELPKSNVGKILRRMLKQDTQNVA
ncbi:AMP-binding protein [Marinobacterium sediminicola]|uniref:Long-chain-fatty-acid--CoA ligase n=1 Tax=Marinobacterium sediminicola TaxID=518898 RepID=A0ABY1S2G2_9GAMM|nr:AMP-binding protein [Marinobacterium sediminicola]ULG70679.1 AMP-binding protein [Marinobacterium sediminicola]SMR77214.1 long-chain acyl-CoA synthetase [Marinobacterium sediminicola]